MRRVLPLEKHHAVFAERDENMLCFPFFEQFFAGAPKISIVCRSVIRFAPGNASRKESFGAVRLHHSEATPIDRMPGIGISRDDLSSHTRVTRNFRNQLIGQEAFAIIFEDDRVRLRDILSNCGYDFCNLCRRWVDKLLAIDTNDLLMTRDDAGLYNGAKRLTLDRIGDVDFFLGQYFPELLATAIFSQRANYGDVINQLTQIARNIGGTSWIK